MLFILKENSNGTNPHTENETYILHMNKKREVICIYWSII